MEVTGQWHSTKYAGINGTIKFIFAQELDKSNPFTCDCVMEYSKDSSFNPRKINKYKLECTYTDNASDREHRIVARDTDFGIKQYFTFTFGSNDLKLWSGFGSCVYPCDMFSLLLFTKDKTNEIVSEN